MKVMEPGFIILNNVNGAEILQDIERAGRICYKSESSANAESCKKFVANLITRGHESVLEHRSISVLIVCDRGVSHELVRHRLASYSQESTRYCNYASSKFGSELTFIRPCFWVDKPLMMEHWTAVMMSAENLYNWMIKNNVTPQEARSILPNSLKTEIRMTANLREWRHFFKLRTASAAHPQMREIAVPMLVMFKQLVPVVFDDIQVDA